MIKIFKKIIKDVATKKIYIISRIFKIDLLDIAHKKIGISNYTNQKVSGELFFIEKKLPEILTNTPIIFDVGANRGNYSRNIKKRFPNSKIYCFEPNPYIFEKINENKENNLLAFNIGMSSKEGEQKMFLSKDDINGELSSLNEDVIKVIHQQKNTNSVNIKTTTIDKFCKDKQINNIDLLKIDTEGHELEILKGASAMIAQKRIRVIQFEFNEMNIISRTFLRDFYDLLKEYDFYRLSEKELIDIRKYKTINEIFRFQNIVAILKNNGTI